MQTSWSPGTACHLCRACTPTTAWPALMAKCFFANCPSEEGQHLLWPPIFNFSFILDSDSFYTFSAKNAPKFQKKLSNGKNSPNPLIQDPTMLNKLSRVHRSISLGHIWSKTWLNGGQQRLWEELVNLTDKWWCNKSEILFNPKTTRLQHFDVH